MFFFISYVNALFNAFTEIMRPTQTPTTEEAIPGMPCFMVIGYKFLISEKNVTLK